MIHSTFTEALALPSTVLGLEEFSDQQSIHCPQELRLIKEAALEGIVVTLFSSEASPWDVVRIK